MATIRNRGEYQWEAQIRRKGYPAQRKTFETKSDAQAWARMIESEIDRGIFVSRVEAERTAFHQLIDRYISEIAPKHKGAYSEIKRLEALKRHPLATRIVATLTSSDFARYRDERLKIRKGNTVKRELALFQCVIALIRRPKVDVFSRAAAAFRPDLDLECIPQTLSCRASILKVAKADIVFCCVDSHEGRLITDLMSQSFMQPLFDVGVVIPTRVDQAGRSCILDINGRIDYVRPGGATLADREVYTPASLRAEELAKCDPDAYAVQVKEGYMPGVLEEAPSVISVNMLAASTCVQELIARLYPYRLSSNQGFARTVFSLADLEYEYFPESAFALNECPLLAAGLAEPLLGIPSLGVL